MKTPNFIRALVVCALGAQLLAVHALRADQPAGLRFELSFPASVQDKPVDGRVFVVITRKADPEPRLQFGKSGGQYASAPFFGEDVEALAPGQTAVIDGRSDGYPLDRLADLPAGDYYVQGFLNLYTTFHRADGHVVKMHMDQWEGQDFPRSPGQSLQRAEEGSTWIRRATETVRLALDRKIPPIEVPRGHDATSSTCASRARCFRSSGGARSSSARRSCCRGITSATRASPTP